MTRAISTDDELRPMIREAFAQIIDELPASTRELPMAGRQAEPHGRRAGSVGLMVAAAVALVAGLAVVAQVRGPDSSAPSAPSPPGSDRPGGDTAAPWADGVRLIVYVNADALDDSLRLIWAELGKLEHLFPPDGIRYLGPEESLREAERLLADDPETFALLTLDNVPTAFYVTPNEGVVYDDLAGAADLLRSLPQVARVEVDPAGRPVIPVIPGAARAEDSSSLDPSPRDTAETVPPTTDHPTSNPPLPAVRTDYLAFGDSIMLSAASELAARGYSVNAEVSRQVVEMVPTMQDLAANDVIGDPVVIHLGNNGPFTTETLDALLEPLAEVPNIVILNLHGDRPWIDTNNHILADHDQPGDNIVLIDWNSLAESCPGDCFGPDGFHLAPDGVAYYATVIGDITGR